MPEWTISPQLSDERFQQVRRSFERLFIQPFGTFEPECILWVAPAPFRVFPPPDPVTRVGSRPSAVSSDGPPPPAIHWHAAAGGPIGWGPPARGGVPGVGR